MTKLLLMFLEFFKTGLFAVGGGLATIPFLREIGVRYGWYTMSDLSTMIAVSESTPGPMGVNMASYVGFSQYGVLGFDCGNTRFGFTKSDYYLYHCQFLREI